MPTKQRLRVNDTLVLELSSPLARFIVYRRPDSAPVKERPGTRVLWCKAALRGRRGYYQVLSQEPNYYSLYQANASPRGDVVGLTIWDDRGEVASQARAHPLDTVWIHRPCDLQYFIWDVRYRTWSALVRADLQELPSPTPSEVVYGFEDSIVGFTGGTYRGHTYRLLPYWLARELARTRRTHHLPPARLLTCYLNFSQDIPAPRRFIYCPLLARLLRAYATCPMPAATARRIALARRHLAQGH